MICIIGAGLAGDAAASTLRAEGYDGPIVMLSDEPHEPYDKPPLSKQALVGDMSEEDILLEVLDNPRHFERPVAEAMESLLVTVPPDAKIEDLVKIFDRGLVAIVVDGEEFLGLITRIDLLNWLRGKM